MKTLIFKVTVCLGVLAVLPVRGQIVDSATLPVLTNDLASQTIRLTEISGLQLVEATQQANLTDLTEKWVVMNDSVQEGLRRFGKGYPDENNDSIQADGSLFEHFWLVRGLWKQIHQMVQLYGDYLSGFDNIDFVTNALRKETMDVFITQGYNTIEVFNNMMGIIRDQSSANPQMSVRQCFTKGEYIKRQVTSINTALKWQLRRVHEYSLMNNQSDPFYRFDTSHGSKGEFDPEDMNKQY